MRMTVLAALLMGCGPARPPPAGPRAPAQPSAPSTPAPLPIELSAAVLPPHGTLMLGDLHGTREIPAAVGRLVAAAVDREAVILALEVPTDELPAIQAFLGSDGGVAARRQLVAGPWWQEAYQDGRRSVAMADLIETVRGLRASGKAVEVVAIDNGSKDGETREAGMARYVIEARRAHPETALIVYAGNLHVSRREVPFRPGFAWMAMRVADAGIPLVSLNARWTDGTAWICPDAVAEHCSVGFFRGAATAPAGVHLESLSDGQYDGWFGVGPLTASPPAGKPELAAGLDAKIAAAWTSPRAVHAKARRAYAEKQYAQCAELLAQVAEPDAGIAYDHACCLALAGRKDDALARLRYAIGAGLADLAHVESDPDLASLRDDPRWPIKK